MSLYKWGWCVCGKMWIGQYILSLYYLQYMLQCMISSSVISEAMCVVHVKYCNQLLAVNMAGVACKEL